ncbi:MAG: CRISPR-associated endonuclease Cas1 [Sulfurovum sp.]|nr:CRISPR-associated endonuclease Cas1 [Sulfurovum sp.]
MKTVVIDKKDVSINIDSNAIKVEQQSIPFKFVDLLVLNHRATLKTSDILKLTAADISILLISHSNDNFSLISSANTKNAEIKLAQYHAHKNHLLFAKEFISKKIRSHARQLQKNEIPVDASEELKNIQEANSIDEIMGIEGAFAARYFKAYFSLLPQNMHKSKRSKQPPLDPVNALLSYWYSLYYNIITVKLIGYGFEPSIGYLHKPFREHNALSSDLLEIFRSHINEAVLQLFKNNVLEQSDFSKKGGVYLKFEGRKKVWSHFLALCEVLQPLLDEEISNLKKMIHHENDTHH